MADFIQHGTARNATVGINTGTGAAVGTATPSSASQYAKGSWSQLIAATPFDSGLMMVYLSRVDLGGAFLVDLAIGGAGSEQVIVSNLNTITGGSGDNTCRYLLPIIVPAGVRLSARSSYTVAGSNSVNVSATLFGRSLSQPPAFSGVDLISVDRVNVGQIPYHQLNGTINVRSAWMQHTAATTREYKAIALAQAGYASAAGAPAYIVLDYAMGGAGAEQPFLTDIGLAVDNTSFGRMDVAGPLPIPIPAGVRISSRAMSNVSNANNYAICGLYGFY